MAVGDADVFPGFLTSVLTQLFFQKPTTTFLTGFCRGKRRKCGDHTNNHRVMSPTRSLLSIRAGLLKFSTFTYVILTVQQNKEQLAKGLKRELTQRLTKKPEIFCRISFVLTLSQTTNFRLYQIEKVCRREF